MQVGVIVDTRKGLGDGLLQALWRRECGTGLASSSRPLMRLFAADLLVRLPVGLLAVPGAVQRRAALGAFLQLSRSLLTAVACTLHLGKCGSLQGCYQQRRADDDMREALSECRANYDNLL